MINELAPGHQHDGDGVVVPALVLKDDSVPEKRMTIINSALYFHSTGIFLIYSSLLVYNACKWEKLQ
jgi:hypothetical protein